jgi:hypothetical protein
MGWTKRSDAVRFFEEARLNANKEVTRILKEFDKAPEESRWPLLLAYHKAIQELDRLCQSLSDYKTMNGKAQEVLTMCSELTFIRRPNDNTLPPGYTRSGIH